MISFIKYQPLDVRMKVGFVILLAFAAAFVYVPAADASDAIKPVINPIHIEKTDRILVIAPHPDDESLATAGLIRHAVERQIPVLVVLMNNGDGYKKAVQIKFRTLNPTPDQFKNLGEIRHLESLTAMKSLGLTDKDVIYLSYPDGGTNTLLNEAWDCDKLHTGANGSNHSPYSFGYEKNAPYCGENVVKNLEQIIASFMPSMVFFPDPGDDHHDHWATAAFVKYTLTKMDYAGRQYTYLVHKGRSWPVPWKYKPDMPMLPPQNLVGYDEKWYELRLSTADEKLKHAAVGKYVSQKGMMEPFLESFVRKNELFAEYPTIKVETTKRFPKFFSTQIMPDIVFRDPPGDSKPYRYTAGDIAAVGLVYNGEYLWIALQTRKNISPEIPYGFHLRIFGKNGVSRIDIKVKGGRIYSEKPAKSSITYDSIIPFETEKDRIVVQLPASIFADQTRKFMLNVDTFNPKTSKRIDRTAWRIFELQQNGLPKGEIKNEK